MAGMNWELDGGLITTIPPAEMTGLMNESWHCKVMDMYYVVYYSPYPYDNVTPPTMKRSTELPLPLVEANIELKRTLSKFPRAEIVSCRDACKDCLYRGGT